MSGQKCFNRLFVSVCLPAIFVATSSLLSPVMADEIFMANGDRITGEVVRQDVDVLNLKTPYAGTLKIEWDQVVEVNLDEPRKVLLDDETVLMVRAFSRKEDQLILVLTQASSPVTIDASRVKVIKPEPWELGDGYKISGLVEIATKRQKGNSEKTELDLDFMFKMRWLNSQFSSYGQVEYDTTRGLKSSENWTSLNHYDYTFTDKWFASGSLFFKHDQFADLQLRTSFGPGIGYRFYSSKALNLRTEAGINYLNDNFYDQPDSKFWGLAWFIDYDQKFWKQRLQFYHRQLGFAAIDSSSKFLWSSWTGIRVPLVAGIVGSVEYEIDYDNEPAIAAEATDQTFKFKLGYKW